MWMMICELTRKISSKIREVGLEFRISSKPKMVITVRIRNILSPGVGFLYVQVYSKRECIYNQSGDRRLRMIDCGVLPVLTLAVWCGT